MASATSVSPTRMPRSSACCAISSWSISPFSVSTLRLSCLALSVVYLPPRIWDICRKRLEYAWVKSLAVTSSPFTRAAQVSGVRVRKPEEPRPKEKMKVRMIAPKIRAISEDFAFDRITSSIGPATPSVGWCGRPKAPSARTLGKLDSLKKPGDRCKGKNPGRDRLLPRVLSLRALHLQALSRADLRDCPAGCPVRALLRPGQEGPRSQSPRPGGDLHHRPGREGHHPGRLRGGGRLAGLRRLARRPRGEPQAPAGQPESQPARAADGRAEAGERAPAPLARLRGQAASRPPAHRPRRGGRRLAPLAHAPYRPWDRRRSGQRCAGDRAGGRGGHRHAAHRQLRRRPADPEPPQRHSRHRAAHPQPQHGQGDRRHRPLQADLRAPCRRSPGKRRAGDGGRAGLLSPRPSHRAGGERGQEVARPLPRSRRGSGGRFLTPRRSPGGGSCAPGRRAGSAREWSVTWRAGLVLLVAAGLAILESVIPHLFHLRAARPDLLLIVVLYLALRDDVVQGAALSAATGYLSDLASATPAFLYTFLAVLTFVVVRTAGAALRTEGGIQSAVVAFGATLGHSLVATLIFGFFTGSGLHFEAAPLLWSAFGTAIAAPFVFAVLRRLDAGFQHADEAPGGLL